MTYDLRRHDPSERYFKTATAEQLRATAKACRRAERLGDDEDWNSDEAEEARRLTADLDWSWDFETWSHAAYILECEAELADMEEP